VVSLPETAETKPTGVHPTKFWKFGIFLKGVVYTFFIWYLLKIWYILIGGFAVVEILNQFVWFITNFTQSATEKPISYFNAI